MKKDKWLIYVIVAFTSITTYLLLTDNTFLGFIRAAVATVILDGLVTYWEDKRHTLKADKQRTYAGYMMWAGVGIMFIFAAGYGVEMFAPVDAMKNVDIFGVIFTIPITEFILMLAASLIGGWVVLTLGVLLYLRGIDPDIIRERERQQVLDEAEKERNDREDRAYKLAWSATAEIEGNERGVLAFKEQLIQGGKHSEYEIEQLVVMARAKIHENKTGATSVNTPQPVFNTHNADTVNPTPPSTQTR